VLRVTPVAVPPVELVEDSEIRNKALFFQAFMDLGFGPRGICARQSIGIGIFSGMLITRDFWGTGHV